MHIKINTDTNNMKIQIIIYYKRELASLKEKQKQQNAQQVVTLIDKVKIYTTLC